MAANEEKSTAELEQQRKAQQQQMMMMQKMQKIQMVSNIVSQMDPTTVLKAICSQFGVSLSITSNPWYSQSLTQCIYNSLLKGTLDDDTLKDIFNALNNAISLTNNIRMFGSFGGNSMMGGMGMGMPGMNPMMGMGMNPMMGMMGMNPMMGMGMNPMMGMMGMNPMMNQQTTDATADSDKLKKFVEQNIWNADPLVFIQTLITNGIDVDFSEDQNFRNTTNQCIVAAISNVGQPMQFEYICNIVGSLYYTNMQQQYQEKMKQNGGNTQNNMMGGMNMMNPMMGMMGMNPMMGMGMNPMMGGMMNPMMGMMGGMQTGFDSNGNTQNNMMGGMNMMNPMMGMMGMNPMMSGMNMGMGMMPGMNQFNGAGSGSNGAFF